MWVGSLGVRSRMGSLGCRFLWLGGDFYVIGSFLCWFLWYGGFYGSFFDNYLSIQNKHIKVKILIIASLQPHILNLDNLLLHSST